MKSLFIFGFLLLCGRFEICAKLPAGVGTWPFDKPFHLILNIAIGGSWGGARGVDDSIFPQKMEVDYVRVYQQKSKISVLQVAKIAINK